MGKVEQKKQRAIESVAQFILINGLSKIGLRTLAQAAETSDRMLIYYFGSKNELLNQALSYIASGLTEQLDSMLGTHQRPAEKLLEELMLATHNDAFDPIVRLWFELIGLAARGKEPYVSNAQALADSWVNWLTSRVEQAKANEIQDMFALVEGRLMLKLIQSG